MNGKHHDGNKNGKLLFKIRKNDDIPDFNEKRINLFKKISDEVGLDLKKAHDINTKRPL